MPILKDVSKTNWTVASEHEGLTENINTSCFMRIADAVEKMVSKYDKMESDLKWYQENYRKKNAEIEILNKRIAAYKGWIKRLKNKPASL